MVLTVPANVGRRPETGPPTLSSQSSHSFWIFPFLGGMGSVSGAYQFLCLNEQYELVFLKPV